MKFNELQHIQKPQPEPDTYEAGMAQNQLLKIGSHAVRLHNMLDDGQEMESWVAKKIDLASNYVKSVHGYTAGQKAGTYDDDGMSEEKQCPPGQYYCKMSGKCKPIQEDTAVTDKEIKMAKGIAFDKRNKDNMSKATSTIEKVRKGLSQQPDVADALRTANEDAGDEAMAKEIAKVYDNVVAYIQSDSDNDPNDQGGLRSGYDDEDLRDAEDLAREFRKNLQSGLMLRKKIKMKQSQDSGDMDKGDWDPFQDEGLYNDLIKDILAKYKKSAVQEDAGEGHMSKSQLYATAKMAIELIDMIKKGDDLEGWVQTKLNLAADYLQAVYHYEDYQKLNPYREEIDGALMQRHAQVIQKNLDEILARETKVADVDTKPGMMRILKKRVNEVEKEIAKENRKETNESGILYRAGVKKYGKAGMTAIQSAAAKGANHQEIGKIKDKHLKDDENLEEGIKEWGQRLAMAGVIVAGLAGVNSINNAIDNSVPAISAMNTALEMAQDSGNDELAQMITKDLSNAKIRLSSGKDLGAVAELQDKYAKFMKTEGLAYESRLLVSLKQQLK